MITIQEICALLNDIENDRVERTISTTNTDKFGQAICAFANDLPNHRQPGYLFLGVEDDGTVKGLNVTDELLKNIAAILKKLFLK
jgi:ATP-dependent DNA helicase RecG